ncbi:MAG: DUF4442 domain-containing protein [Chitinophagales bacterium]|nr:DUF4442 domain-containing protein [Chitinophagales bacterium]
MSTATAPLEQKVTMEPWQQQFVNRLKNPFLFRMFLLAKLPLGFFSGMRVREMDTQRCVATVPYGWRTRNPFKSTYFAALSMAAELSTGALALFAVEKRKPSVAVIIIGMEAEFPKRAVNVTTFTCEEGQLLFDAVERTIATGNAETVTVTTIGKSEDGIEVARFRFTWSFKRRK